jgi:hypothetical protein
MLPSSIFHCKRSENGFGSLLSGKSENNQLAGGSGTLQPVSKLQGNLARRRRHHRMIRAAGFLAFGFASLEEICCNTPIPWNVIIISWAALLVE